MYPILAFFNRFGRERIPASWRNVDIIGGVRGALFIALAASITTSAIMTSNDVNEISTMVSGVAFISITFQAGILFKYVKGTFPQNLDREHEQLNIKLAKARSAIWVLQK